MHLIQKKLYEGYIQYIAVTQTRADPIIRFLSFSNLRKFLIIIVNSFIFTKEKM